MGINFLNDKFRCPPLPDICVSRQELFKHYNKTAKTRLAAVCAPAGYGKTVSVLLWAKMTKQKVVWIGLDKYDNDLASFYNLFCTGIISTQPDNYHLQDVLLSNTFNATPVEHTINLLSKYAPSENSYTFILDDFHTITNPEISETLPYILTRLPYSFTILILSRGQIFDNLIDFIKKRNAELITTEQLAFSATEIQKYYRHFDYHLNQEQAQMILKKTDGWAIGIVALSVSNPLEKILTNDQFINDYITCNIWNKWSPELQQTMLVTAVPDELDPEFFGFLTGQTKPAEILEQLIHQNAFIIRTPKNTYRYYHFFLTFLRTKLAEHPHIDVRSLNLMTADHYFERQDFFSALDYYIRAEHLDGINRSFYLLNTLFMDYSVAEWLYQFTNLVQDHLSEDVIQNDPPLLVEYAWANFLNGNAEATLRYIDRINACLTEAEHLATIRESNLLGSISIIRFADFRQNIWTYAMDFSKLAHLLPEDHAVKLYSPSITQNFPIMHRSIFDCLEIIPDLDNRLQLIKDAFGLFFPQDVDLFCLCVKAGLYYELNNLESAYKTIGLTQKLLEKDTRFEMQFCVSMILSLILNAMDKKCASESTRKNFNLQIQTTNGQYLYPNFSAIDIKQRLWDADRNAAQLWLAESFVTIDQPLCFYKIYQYFTTARAYIVLSKKTEAQKLLKQLKKLSADYHRPLDLAETNILKAILEWSTGSKKMALQTLEDVLIALQPYRAIRIIADEGTSVLPILKKLTTKTGQPDYQGPLEPHYLKQVYLCAYQVSKKHLGISAHLNEQSIKLSKQQKYILALLVEGYSPAEIVNLTGRTINTVKSHTKILYQKLDVHNAADAVLKAQQLGLLESLI